MTIAKAHKDTIERQIVEIALNGLKNQSLTQDAVRDIGQFVLDRMDSIQTNIELLEFLSEMSEKWSVFQPLIVLEKADTVDKNEQKAVDDMLSLVKQGKVEDAIMLAKTMTEQPAHQ